MEMRVSMVGMLVVIAWAGGAVSREWRLEYKTCGADGEGMEAVVEKSVMGMHIVSNGYYRAHSQRVDMMGQCDAHLDACGCLQCFTHALRQCPASLSAQIRLNMCSLAFSYHPPSFPPGRVNNNTSSSTRIAAIVVGAVVAVCLAFIFLFFLRSRYSKRDYYY